MYASVSFAPFLFIRHSHPQPAPAQGSAEWGSIKFVRKICQSGDAQLLGKILISNTLYSQLLCPYVAVKV